MLIRLSIAWKPPKYSTDAWSAMRTSYKHSQPFSFGLMGQFAITIINLSFAQWFFIILFCCFVHFGSVWLGLLRWRLCRMFILLELTPMLRQEWKDNATAEDGSTNNSHFDLDWSMWTAICYWLETIDVDLCEFDFNLHFARVKLLKIRHFSQKSESGVYRYLFWNDPAVLLSFRWNAI